MGVAGWRTRAVYKKWEFVVREAKDKRMWL
jgi:hypothetical protein